MSDLSELVRAAQGGDAAAFGALVERFQDMAYAYAWSLLGDAHLAEDVAQEAFLDAYRSLPGLREPAAFVTWLRKIVFKHSDRQTRGRRAATVALDEGLALASAEPDPAAAAERREDHALVRDAVAALPEHERAVTALFYLAGYAQSEIAASLGLPLTTVKKRLFDARRRLKERMLTMFESQAQGQRPSRSPRFSSTVQFLIAVRSGDLAAASAQLAARPELARARAGRDEGYWPGLYMPMGNFTAIGEAVAAGNRPLAELLIAHGADISAQPLLHEAAARGHTELLDLLLAHGAPIDQLARNGQTALHWAAIYGRREAAALLLSRGAAVDVASANGRTPLHWAAIHGDRPLAELLLAHGARRDLRDVAGLTPAGWAARRGHEELAGLLEAPS